MSNRVLILRDPALSSELASLLEADGYEFTFLPVTRTEFIRPVQVPIQSCQWIAFTSANGVRGLSGTLNSQTRTIPPRVGIAAVGKATAQVVVQLFGRDPDLVSDVPDGSSLAEILTKSVPTGTSILFPSSAGHSSDFAEICRANGLNVHVLPVYRTIAVSAEDIRSRFEPLENYETAIFFAPSGVKAFHAAVPAPWTFTAIAIGSTTERALSQVGQPAVIRSAGTEPQAIALAARAVHFVE